MATCQIDHCYYILVIPYNYVSFKVYSITFVIAGTVGNVSFNVTFDVGASEACFEFVLDDEMVNTDHFRLKIVSNTEKIMLDKDLEITLIIVVDAESRECIMTVYYRHDQLTVWIRIYICMCSDWQATKNMYTARNWHSNHLIICVYVHNFTQLVHHPSSFGRHLSTRKQPSPALNWIVASFLVGW